MSGTTTASRELSHPQTRRPLTRPQVAMLVAGVGLGCASMVLAARGAAASGSGAALVLPSTMACLLVVLSATSAIQGRATGTGEGTDARRDQAIGWGVGGTLGLFGTALGWIGWGMDHALPSWPLVGLAALVVALPTLGAALRIARGGDRG